MTNKNSTSSAAAPAKTFQVDALTVRVYRQQKDMAQHVAQIAQKYLQEILAGQPSAAVILATGNSQIEFLETLIALGGVEWPRLILFHMDEYLGIDAGHKASFRRALQAAFLVEPTEEWRSEGRGRPAQLFRYAPRRRRATRRGVRFDLIEQRD